MRIVVQTPLAPPGTHVTELRAVETVTGPFDRPALSWRFVVAEGPHAGTEVTRVTGLAARPGNQLGDLLSQLTGRPVEAGREIDAGALVGRRFEVVATPLAGGGVAVGRVRPIQSTNKSEVR